MSAGVILSLRMLILCVASTVKGVHGCTGISHIGEVGDIVAIVGIAAPFDGRTLVVECDSPTARIRGIYMKHDAPRRLSRGREIGSTDNASIGAKDVTNADILPKKESRQQQGENNKGMSKRFYIHVRWAVR